jgi:hypothetical protein
LSREPYEPPRYASPVCYADQVEPEQGPLSDEAIARQLNELIEGERAGARGLVALARAQASGPLADLLDAVARDEARFCAMLSRHVRRLGATPSAATGTFHDKLLKREGLQAQLVLLDRGQKAVVRSLEILLPLVGDSALRADLDDMRLVHERNIERCAAWIE